MKNYFAVKKVKVVDDYQLILTFSNGEKRLFDMKPYLNKGIFKELLNVELFKSAHICFDTVEWDNEADLDPEVFYNSGKKINPKKYSAGKFSFSRAAESKTKFQKK